MNAIAQRPPFPEVVDSSLMAHFRACPQLAFLESFEHWKPRHGSVHLVAGAAFAAGIEAARNAFYRDGLGESEAVGLGLRALMAAYGDFECPPDSAKSLERMLGALEYFFSEYRMPDDAAKPARLPGGRLGIEFSFAEPIDFPHPMTGNPLIYSGRFDMLADFAGGLYGDDEKTTSQLGASWAKQWDLRSQFTAYTWGAQRAGLALDGFIVRGISILKTKYDTQQAITYRPQWMIDRWYDQLLRDLTRMVQMWESGVWDLNLDDSCNAYGGCKFRKVCLSEPHRQVNWLVQDFQRRRWDPVTRIETVLEGPPT